MSRSAPVDSPETWPPARRLAERVLRPIERYLHVEAASGVVLLVTTVAALVWANLWPQSYDAVWHAPLTVGIGGLVSAKPLHFWINDGLMTVFFLVVGLEIRREIAEGELSAPSRAALPLAAAVGGMVAPALLYLSLARESAVRVGWGIPMATDIAFAVGVLALLGKRVPPALRVLLLALAVIDDIGAVLVIAFAYSSGIAPAGLMIAGCGLVLVFVLQRLGVRRAVAYVVPGAILWFGILRAGIHPTIAGVILGLATPARRWFGKEGFVEVAREAIDDFADREEQHVHELLGPLDRIDEARREALSPVVRLQAVLHAWVAYGVMPLFALANAGVYLRGVSLHGAQHGTVAVAVIVGLLIGKPVGVLAASFVTVRLGLCKLPRGVTWQGVFVVGCVAGIGFTMAIFIGGLALADPALLAAAKLGVLCASAAAAAIGLLVGRLLLRRGNGEPGEARTHAEAESSTDA